MVEKKPNTTFRTDKLNLKTLRDQLVIERDFAVWIGECCDRYKHVVISNWKTREIRATFDIGRLVPRKYSPCVSRYEEQRCTHCKTHY